VWLTQNRKKCALICVFGFMVMVAVYWNTNLNSFNQIYVPTLLGIGLALFLIGGLRLSFFEARYLKIFSLPGKYCFGGYLLHSMVLAIVFPILFQAKVWWGFSLLVSKTWGVA